MEIASFYKIYGDVMNMRKMSFQTQKSYFWHLQKFIDYTKERVDKLSSSHIHNYLVYLNTKNVSDSFFNQSINAVRFAFKYVLNRKIKDYMVVRPKRAITQPIILDISEIQALLKACTNIKHKAILYLLCTTGIRVSEIINLKITDIDSKSMVIHIIQSKGRRDRLLPLTQDCLNVLRNYFKQYRPVIYLFNGQNNIPKYSNSSIRQFLIKYAAIAGIKKKIHPHLLRHTYLTLLMESVKDIHSVRIVAGHKNPLTTANYIHLSTKYISSMNNNLKISA